MFLTRLDGVIGKCSRVFAFRGYDAAYCGYRSASIRLRVDAVQGCLLVSCGLTAISDLLP